MFKNKSKIVLIIIFNMKKISSKSKHKEILKLNRLKKLEEKMKINIIKRKKILSSKKNG